MNEEGNYAKLGVSHGKEDVHEAIKGMDKGLYPNAFCKIMPDVSKDPEYCSVFHSDSAGTKSTLAYMMYKETGDINYFKGIVQDAIVMNVDDVLCAGVTGNSLISDTIGRNKKLISGDIIGILIREHAEFTKKLTEWGFDVALAGGETEDVGDIVRTLEVGVSLFARVKRSDIITGDSVTAGDVIIGLKSEGTCNYDDNFNSSIGSNGLTLARHGTLDHKYYSKYPECRDPHLDENIAFFGKYDLLDGLKGTPLKVGEALLSPTRTYAPIITQVLSKFRKEIHAMFHNTGGGQSKCLHFGSGIKYIKDNLFKTPKLFELIQDSSQTDWKEMYQVFNMGHRMELIVPDDISSEIIKISKNFGVDAKVVGRIEKSSSSKNELKISSEFGEFNY